MKIFTMFITEVIRLGLMAVEKILMLVFQKRNLVIQKLLIAINKILVCDHFFLFESTYSASHNMPTYIEAINNESKLQKDNSHYLSLLCSCHSSIILDINNLIDYSSINLFLSNFVETGKIGYFDNRNTYIFDPYRCGEKDLMFWGYDHMHHNRNGIGSHIEKNTKFAQMLFPEKYSDDDIMYDTKVGVNYIEDVVNEYCDINISFGRNDRVIDDSTIIRDNYYYTSETGGNMHAGFGLIDSLSYVGGNMYHATYKSYGAGYCQATESNDYASYSHAKVYNEFKQRIDSEGYIDFKVFIKDSRRIFKLIYLESTWK